MTTPKEYQVELTQMLMAKFKPAPVTSSWRPFEGMGRRIYQPVVDIAIGPFATEGRYITEYDNLIRDESSLIDEWAQMFQSNWHNVIGDHYFAVPPPKPKSYEDYLGINSNQNARCFMAIEIENKNSKKHMMGSIINAGALGRVGILVAWHDSALRTAIRMRQYFSFLRTAEKRTFDMSGVLILTKDQFEDSLSN